MKITRTCSRLPKEVGVLLGKEIQLARKEKAWSEKTLNINGKKLIKSLLSKDFFKS